jgi:HAD superfamily hydrolase (TIGR02253 family)
MVKAILFDLDNTLIDFMKMKRASCDAALSAMISAGLKINKAEATRKLFELYDKHGIEYNHIFQEFIKSVENELDYRMLAKGIFAYRTMQTGLVEPYPGVVQTLLKLREKGLKLAIVTDAPKLKAWLRLVEMRLDSFFDVVVCYEDTHEHKPNKKPFLLALDRLGIRPKDALFVGDWPERDVLGARKLGIKTVFAQYGYSFPKKPSVKADYAIKNFEELLKVVKKEK